FDWNKLFDAAGLDASRWIPAESHEIPSVGFDERKAWTGTYDGSPELRIRIEAAAWKGRPVYFETFGPWKPARSSTPATQAPNWEPLVLTIILVVACLFSILNLRNGRGDSSGALRLAVFVLCCGIVARVSRCTTYPHLTNSANCSQRCLLYCWRPFSRARY